jgi:hypothetical protein
MATYSVDDEDEAAEARKYAKALSLGVSPTNQPCARRRFSNGFCGCPVSVKPSEC